MKEQTRRGVLFAGGLLVTLVGLRSEAFGQAATRGPAEIAQRLAQLRDDLASADPNLRLAALEVALVRGSASEQILAMEFALRGRDATMRDLALRFGLSRVRSLNILATHNDRALLTTLTRDRFYEDWGGSLPIQISSFDLQTGLFQAIGQHGGRRGAPVPGVGQVLGSTVMVEANFGFNSSGDTQANINLGLTPTGYLAGTARLSGFLAGGPIRVAAPFTVLPPTSGS